MIAYASHVFDMDGVILASNKAKTDGFYFASLPYGEEAAQAMVTLHRIAGSISRRQRWERFFEEIVQREPYEGEIDVVMSCCSDYIIHGTEAAPLVPGVERFIKSLTVPRFVVSGVEPQELRGLLLKHNVLKLFDGVYGALPGKLKSERLEDLVKRGTIKMPAVYYGDTEDDYYAATRAGLAFVFIHSDSEFTDWSKFFRDKEVLTLPTFNEMTRMKPLVVRLDAHSQVIVDGQVMTFPRTLAGAQVTLR